MTDIQGLIVTLTALTAFGGIMSLIVNVGKLLGLIKDGQSDVIYTGLTLLGLGIVWVFQAFLPSFFPGLPIVDLSKVNAGLGYFVKVGEAILEFLIARQGGTLLYNSVRGVVPVLGYSFSIQQAREVKEINPQQRIKK